MRAICCAQRRATIAAELGSSMGDRELDSVHVLRRRSCATFERHRCRMNAAARRRFTTRSTPPASISPPPTTSSAICSEASRLTSEEADAAARKWEEQEDELGRANFAKLLTMDAVPADGRGIGVAGRSRHISASRSNASGGVRAFLFDKLPRYADALKDILNAAVDVGPASARS